MLTQNTKVGAGHPQLFGQSDYSGSKSDFVNLINSDVSAEKSDDYLVFYGIFGANQTGRGA